MRASGVTQPETIDSIAGEPADLSLIATLASRQAVELRLLHQIRHALESDLDAHGMTRRIVDQVAQSFGYTHVSVYAVEDDQWLALQHQVGYDSVLDRIPLNSGVVGRVARSGAPELITAPQDDPDFLAAVGGITSEVCVPFHRRGEIAGVLNVETVGEPGLGPGDLRLMIEVCGFLSLALEQSELRAAFEASERRLEIALDSAGMGTWFWNPSTGDVRWSEQMAAVYGIEGDPKELNQEEWFELLHPDDRERIRRIDRDVLATGDDYAAEFRVLSPGGAVRWLEAKGKVVERTASGQVTSVVGVTMDVTARKRLEEERLRLAQVEAARRQAEQAQRQIADTLERITASFIAVDHSWRLTYVNQRAIDLLGRPAEQLVGRELWMALPDLVETRFERLLRRAAVQQRATVFDFHLPSRDRWLEVHAFPSPDGLTAYLSDVTLRRQAEEERRRIEARFRSLVRNASDVILILDRQGVVRYASPAVERVIGRPPEEIVGRSNVEWVHPADAKRLLLAFVRIAKKPGDSAPLLYRFRHRDGRYRWMEVTATNLFDDPAIRGIVANCRDVTERQEAEFNLWFLAETAAVLGSSLELQTTLTSVARMVVAHLADFCVVDVIDEQGEVECVAVAHRDSQRERELARFRDEHPLNPDAPFGPGLALRSGRSVWYETIDESFARDEGIDEARWRRMRRFGFGSAIASPLIARGGIIGVLSVGSATPGRFTESDVGLVEELTRRAALAVENARLYASAQQAIAARDQFLSVAAHELRTPITAITGFSALLEREVNQRNDPERISRFVHHVTDAGSRLANLVEDVLDVSRIRLGQLPLRVDDVDMTDLIGRVASRYDEQIARERHRIELKLPEAACSVRGDVYRLEQVVANLIENAVKYSPGGGTVMVTLERAGRGVRVTVRDDGIGLPRTDQESIFLPFGRADNALRSNVPGLGIGLYICRNIVERHGGRIWAESAGEGLGSTIGIWLPDDWDFGEGATDSPRSA